MLTLKERIQAFKTKCLGKILRISYSEHKTNDWVWSKINFLVGPQEPLLATVNRRKLAWFGHITRYGSVSKTILQGIRRVGDAVVGRGNAGWTTKNGNHCPCQSCSQEHPAENTGGESLLNRLSCPLMTQSVKGLNSTELNAIRDRMHYQWL